MEINHMKPIKTVFIVLALAALGGCVAVPVYPDYYHAGPPAYHGSSVYYGPSVGVGVYRGGYGHGHGYGRSRGRGYR